MEIIVSQNDTDLSFLFWYKIFSSFVKFLVRLSAWTFEMSSGHMEWDEWLHRFTRCPTLDSFDRYHVQSISMKACHWCVVWYLDTVTVIIIEIWDVLNHSYIMLWRVTRESVHLYLASGIQLNRVWMILIEAVQYRATEHKTAGPV